MSNTDKYRTRLINLLKELFQLDQPELDFGFYKIMHAKSVQIGSFLENDLLKIIQDAFGEVDENRVVEARAHYEAAIEQAKKFGAPNPEQTDGVKEAKTLYEQAKDGGNAESEIYDHLYRFFERYYDNGDFMSRRYYARESDSRAAPYAVPYDGREVYLHWANKDQYYIKSSEYLSNYSFDLNEALRQQAKSQDLEQFAGHDRQALKVHFKLVDAGEGEHGNIKAAGDQKRFFLIHAAKPVELLPLPQGEGRGEGDQQLIVNFEYRTDPDKTGQDNKWQETRLQQAEAAIVEALKNHDAADFLKALTVPAPTGSKDKRTLLGKYLQKYAARNTMDYFIHKDLGGFLRRELDFYIKNEIMRLDDIENADAAQVQNYLASIRVLRSIARQLIAFLAQLEEFQKKLWLKKKFITESHYCITLDRVDPKLYPEIAANKRQREEWLKLFAIDEIAADLAQPGYSAPLTVEFLTANPFLLVDTALFSDDFKQRLLSEIPDLDAQCDGVLIHSENFQALGLMQEKYREQVKCVYIDPPYNTGDGDFNYKDSYKHSSWLGFMTDRLLLGSMLQKDNGALFCNIDDNEFSRFKEVLENCSLYSRFVSNVIWKHTEQSKNDELNFSRQWNYLTCFGMPGLGRFRLPRTTEDNKNYSNPDNDPRGLWRSGDVRSPNYRKTLCFEIETPSGGRILPPKNGWRWSKDQVLAKIETGEIIFSKDETKIIRKIYLDNQEGRVPENLWLGERFGTTRSATSDLKDIFSVSPFDTPKPKELIQKIIELFETYDMYILDYFAGSGTTAHSVININRAGNSELKYILVEQNDYFDTVLKPRIQKVVYSKDWKSGKPVSREGISHCFKYLRLESYEDVLNNLAFREDAARDRALTNNPELRRDYLLNYFLDVETQGSQSLLNIADFRDPTAYKLWIKKPGSESQTLQSIDLIETFNWLIGLWVQHMAAPQVFSAEFARETDPDLPKDQNTRLVCKRLKTDSQGDYWFRLIEGYTLKLPGNNDSKIPTLIVWRKLTNDPEKDNAALETYLKTFAISTREQTFKAIYVNGSHTLPNPVIEGEQIKVRLIEDAFHAAMWAGE